MVVFIAVFIYLAKSFMTLDHNCATTDIILSLDIYSRRLRICFKRASADVSN